MRPMVILYPPCYQFLMSLRLCSTAPFSDLQALAFGIVAIISHLLKFLYLGISFFYFSSVLWRICLFVYVEELLMRSPHKPDVLQFQVSANLLPYIFVLMSGQRY